MLCTRICTIWSHRFPESKASWFLGDRVNVHVFWGGKEPIPGECLLSPQEKGLNSMALVVQQTHRMKVLLTASIVLIRVALVQPSGSFQKSEEEHE